MRRPTGLVDDDVPVGTVRGFEVDGRFVVVWRTDDGSLVAGDGRCPHQWSPLDIDGVVEGDELVCRAHAWRFGRDGCGTKVNVRGRRDRKGDLDVYPVGVDGAVIWIDLGD